MKYEKESVVKLIHQTWKTSEIPHDVYPKVWQESWKTHHPDWEYRLWTDEDNERLVRDHYPQFLEGYRSLSKGVIKSDIARALYMHRDGGMYADLDFVCLKPFDGLLEALGSSIVIGRHNQRLQPHPNAWLYSPPGKQFWLSLVSDGLNDWTDRKRRKVEEIAGPDRLNWCLEKYATDHAVLPAVTVYPHTWGDHDSTLYAGTVKWEDVPQLEAAYPNSLAATCWKHNW
jgi:hypothetical protein